MALALSLGLSLALAGTASAGAFGPPMDFGGCGDMDIADNVLTDPETAFIFADEPSDCERLCSKTERLCKGYVKRVAACEIGVYRDQETFLKRNCETIFDDSAARKACKQGAHESIVAGIADTKLDRDASLDTCSEWAETCTGACNAP